MIIHNIKYYMLGTHIKLKKIIKKRIKVILIDVITLFIFYFFYLYVCLNFLSKYLYLYKTISIRIITVTQYNFTKNTLCSF